MSDGVPAFLTVEEAGALLRIGRTKAYAMTREWRATGGKSGLPVVDLGDILRVPRAALEELAGCALDAELLKPAADEPATTPTIALAPPVEPTRPAPRARRTSTDQPGLFDLPPAS